ncbi:MAG: nuclear transport factor 2 family protein [Pseudolabrys sp.]|nr:nuclear transport factor 2 family protein [Pseudolabrys sp.]
MKREVVEGFYRALTARNYDRVALYLDDNIKWSISGPVELLPFCGQRHGKAAAMDVITRLVPSVLATRDLIPDMKLVDGDCAAILARLHGTQPNGRKISYRICHFLRFRNNKIVEYSSVLDTFDAAEQVIGHHIELPKHEAPTSADDDLVAV